MFDQDKIERVMKTLGLDEMQAVKHLRTQELAQQFYKQKREAAIQELVNRFYEK